MQDKMRSQQRLARDLASLVQSLQEDVVLPFIDAFWKTMAREWNGIGALRYVIVIIVTTGLLDTEFWMATGWTNSFI